MSIDKKESPPLSRWGLQKQRRRHLTMDVVSWNRKLDVFWRQGLKRRRITRRRPPVGPLPRAKPRVTDCQGGTLAGAAIVQTFRWALWRSTGALLSYTNPVKAELGMGPAVSAPTIEMLGIVLWTLYKSFLNFIINYNSLCSRTSTEIARAQLQ